VTARSQTELYPLAAMHPFGSSASKARGIDVESRGETCGAAREGLLLEPTGDEWSKLFVGRVAESPIRVLAGSPRQTKCRQGHPRECWQGHPRECWQDLQKESW